MSDWLDQADGVARGLLKPRVGIGVACLYSLADSINISALTCRYHICYSLKNERRLIMTDYNHLKKPAHVKEHIWQQHLRWMEVVGKQADENFKKMSKQAGDRGNTGRTSSGNI